MKIKGGVWRWMPEGARLMLILLAAERTSRRWKKKATAATEAQ